MGEIMTHHDGSVMMAHDAMTERFMITPYSYGVIMKSCVIASSWFQDHDAMTELSTYHELCESEQGPDAYDTTFHDHASRAHTAAIAKLASFRHESILSGAC